MFEHDFRNVGDNHFVCWHCKLDSYDADGIPCYGVRTFVCPTQGNAFSHRSCFQTFESRQDAEDHWMDVHSPF